MFLRTPRRPGFPKTGLIDPSRTPLRTRSLNPKNGLKHLHGPTGDAIRLAPFVAAPAFSARRITVSNTREKRRAALPRVRPVGPPANDSGHPPCPLEGIPSLRAFVAAPTGGGRNSRIAGSEAILRKNCN